MKAKALKPLFVGTGRRLLAVRRAVSNRIDYDSQCACSLVRGKFTEHHVFVVL